MGIIDYKVSVIAAQRTWQAVAGVLTMVLSTTFLSLEQQGWFYTFLSVASLYYVFDMGLSTAIIHIVAHQSVSLNWTPSGYVNGIQAKKFKSFFFQAINFYFYAALAFFFIACIIGFCIFSEKERFGIEPIHWFFPLLILLLLTSFNMMLLPIFAIFEGSGEVFLIYTLKLAQSIIASIVGWVVLYTGGFLWATVATSATAFIAGVAWVLLFKSGVIESYVNGAADKSFKWMVEIWPFQWRTGLGFMSIFFWSQLTTPILFYYQDALVAGQMGLSLTIAHMCGIIAQSWLVKGVAEMSTTAAYKDWPRLTRIFKRNLISAITVYVVLSATILLVVYLLSSTDYSTRILNIWQFIGLFLFVLFYVINTAYATLLRSYKQEPLVWVFVFGAALTILGSFFVARDYSASGIICVLVVTQVLIIFPFAAYICKSVNRKLQNL